MKDYAARLRTRMYEEFELDVVRVSEDDGRTPCGVHDPGMSDAQSV
jgi:hypothetical protein